MNLPEGEKGSTTIEGNAKDQNSRYRWKTTVGCSGLFLLTPHAASPSLPCVPCGSPTASLIPHPASHILHPACRILNPTSRILHPSSRITHPSSRILHPPSCHPHPSSLILHPAPHIPHPSSFIPDPASLILHRPLAATPGAGPEQHLYGKKSMCLQGNADLLPFPN